MRLYRWLSRFFILFAVLLSDLMCAVVAYNYCNMQWHIEYEGASAPASIAFLWVIPYAIGIILCLALAVMFHGKQKEKRKEKE